MGFKIKIYPDTLPFANKSEVKNILLELKARVGLVCRFA
jgi:hypothetical protein